MKFVKMHGLGNDFIILNNLDNNLSDFDFVSFAKKQCDRHFGIGADGVLIISKSDSADVNMRLINADGSEAEMCGNGIRCVAKYLFDNNLASSPVKIETLAGIMRIEQINDAYKVDMGVPKIISPNTKIGDYTTTLVDMGNPHCVIFVDNFDFDWHKIGKALESNKIFPNRSNIEFVKVISPTELDVKVWERGAGATLACGTGACASLAAAFSHKKSANKVKTKLPGGILEIELAQDNRLYMSGPAVKVFEGSI